MSRHFSDIFKTGRKVNETRPANPCTRPLSQDCPARGPFRRPPLAAAARGRAVPLEVVQEVGDQPPPVAFGDPRCAGAAFGAASSHLSLGKADAMPARWFGRARAVQAGGDRPNRKSDGSAAQQVANESAATSKAGRNDIHFAARRASGTDYDESRFAVVSNASMHGNKRGNSDATLQIRFNARSRVGVPSYRAKSFSQSERIARPPYFSRPEHLHRCASRRSADQDANRGKAARMGRDFRRQFA